MPPRLPSAISLSYSVASSSRLLPIASSSRLQSTRTAARTLSTRSTSPLTSTKSDLRLSNIIYKVPWNTAELRSIVLTSLLCNQRSFHASASTASSAKDPYRVLGVAKDASASDIKKTYFTVRMIRPSM